MIRTILSISLIASMLLISSGASYGSAMLIEINEEVENVLEDSMEKEALIEDYASLISHADISAGDHVKLHIAIGIPLCEYFEITSPPPESR